MLLQGERRCLWLQRGSIWWLDGTPPRWEGRAGGRSMEHDLRYTGGALGCRGGSRMDPLWVLVVLVGVAAVCVVGAAVVIAVRVAQVAREVGPKVEEIRSQLSAASAEIARVAGAVREGEATFNTLADKATAASGRVTRVVQAVPAVVGKVQDASLRARATVRAVAVVAARTVRSGRRTRASSRGVTLK